MAKSLAELVTNVSANPAKLDFNPDRWGNTDALKKAVIKAAGNVRGQQDKHDALVEVLTVLLAHVKKRFDGDVLARTAYVAEQRRLEKSREWRERVTGKVDNKVKTV